MVSCAETEIHDPDIPPYLSGCATGDQAGAAAFAARYLAAVRPLHDRYNKFLAGCGLRPYPPGQFLEASPHLNLLLTPDIVRHRRRQALDPARFVYLDGCVRAEAPYDPPSFPQHDGDALVYVSFGSLGASDVELMRRLIAVAARLPYRFLVNVGPYREAYAAVPDNVFLDSWFPQPAVVEQSALFIHHGGNNSFCEALYYGVPSLILPYCWDGHDNARRAEETGVGRRLSRYGWGDDELAAAIRALVEDGAMRQRLARNGRQMRAADGVHVAARAILAAI
jgi:UDP:flavonoid glycosyltransferase YjiC (YdhE family)